jgi:hypothetical protein
LTFAAIAALAIVAIISTVLLQQQLNDIRARVQTLQDEAIALQAQMDNLEAENAALEQRLAEQEAVLATYRQPGTVTIAFGDATGENPTAVGTLTLEPETQTAVLVANNLQPLERRSVYQLWLIRENTPVSAGTFTVDEAGSGSLTVSAVQPGFDAIGVSMEPEGGSEQPTPGKIVLLGTVS